MGFGNCRRGGIAFGPCSSSAHLEPIVNAPELLHDEATHLNNQASLSGETVFLICKIYIQFWLEVTYSSVSDSAGRRDLYHTVPIKVPGQVQIIFGYQFIVKVRRGEDLINVQLFALKDGQLTPLIAVFADHNCVRAGFQTFGFPGFPGRHPLNQ